MPQDVFISYSTKNKEVADAVVAALEANGISCWIAPRNILPGRDWSESIIDAICECRIFFLLLSAASNESEQVKREIQNAVGERLPILPFRIEDFTLSKHMRYFIGTPHWLDALAPPLEPHLERLVETAQRLLSRKEQDEDAADAFAPLDTSAAPAHNLPHQLTSFIGREREIAEVRQLLSATRLVTLTGAGGCGKTRLAIQVASDVLPEYKEGVWLVELAALSESAMIAQEVASALGVREEADRRLQETLTEYLKPKHLLLLLDNCEHMTEACALFAETLLRTCPDLRILATSREDLGVRGEAPWRVPSLALPSLKHLPPLDELCRYEVVQLFVERARTLSPNFSVTEQNAPAVAQICHRLDGIPLAIELAAVRVKVLSAEQIAQRLDDRFRLLTGGSRTALPRQQTLRAAIDWSYDLLAEPERALLHRLSVFVGGWTLDAAEAVGAGDGIEDFEVLDFLSQLVDKSLVLAEEQGGEERYRLLETVRQYSRDKLQSTGEAEDVHNRHASWHLTLAEQAALELDGAEQVTWLDRLETEHDNLRAALEWLLSHGIADEPARMCLALAGLWDKHGYFSESREYLARCLLRQEEIEDVPCRAKLLSAVGWFSYLQGGYDEAEEHQQASLALCREVGDAEGEANALNNLALIAHAQGRMAEAHEQFESSLLIARSLGDLTKQAARLSNLGLLAIQEGQHDEARERLEEARRIYQRGHDEHGTAACLCNLAELALRRRDWAAAETLSQQGLEIFRHLNDRRGIAYSLANLAEAAAHQADYDTTRQRVLEAIAICRETGMHWLVPSLFETCALSQTECGANEDGMFALAAAERLRDEFHVPRSPGEQKKIDEIESVLTTALGDETVDMIRSRTANLKVEAIIAEALHS